MDIINLILAYLILSIPAGLVVLFFKRKSSKELQKLEQTGDHSGAVASPDNKQGRYIACCYLGTSVLIEELVHMDELFYFVSELPVYFTLQHKFQLILTHILEIANMLVVHIRKI